MVYESKKNISILDFGGDVGQHYAALLAKNLKDIEISYTLIDLPSVGHYSNKFWKEEMKDSNISILDSIPFPTLNKIDIAYARSSIQYLKDNPKDYLKRITNMSPKYIGFFENYMSKEDPTYLTTQRYSTGYLIPYWMYNQNDIISFMEENGYKKVFYAEKKCEHYWQLNKEKRNSDRYLTDFIFERLER
jgi:putative methyltransferase (TIGR04325 family)